MPKTIPIIKADDPAVLDQAVSVLLQGGLVIFPTETTYGAGVMATDQKAVDKLLAYKRRREGKPLSIAVPNQAMAEQYVELTETARRLYQRFLPGPVTVVSRSLGRVAEGVASEFGTLGVRIPDYPLILELLRQLDQPITATSANASGERRPYQVSDILDHLSETQKGLIDLIIDAGKLPPNPPSTVIDTTLSTPVTLRQGELQPTETSALSSPTVLQSASEAETRKIAGTLVLQHWDRLKSTGLVIALDGPLGAGKTIFAKGLAKFLGISDTITSPTYTYLEEYRWTRHGIDGKLHHLDVWKIDQSSQLDLLDLSGLLGAKNLVVIEWWSNIAQFSPIQPDIFIQLQELPDGPRQVTIETGIVEGVVQVEGVSP